MNTFLNAVKERKFSTLFSLVAPYQEVVGRIKAANPKIVWETEIQKYYENLRTSFEAPESGVFRIATAPDDVATVNLRRLSAFVPFSSRVSIVEIRSPGASGHPSADLEVFVRLDYPDLESAPYDKEVSPPRRLKRILIMIPVEVGNGLISGNVYRTVDAGREHYVEPLVAIGFNCGTSSVYPTQLTCEIKTKGGLPPYRWTLRVNDQDPTGLLDRYRKNYVYWLSPTESQERTTPAYTVGYTTPIEQPHDFPEFRFEISFNGCHDSDPFMWPEDAHLPIRLAALVTDSSMPLQKVLLEIADSTGPRNFPSAEECRIERADPAILRNEAMAGAQLGNLRNSCNLFASRYPERGFPKSLHVLGPDGEKLIDERLASGIGRGYRFSYVVGPADSKGRITTYRIIARPEMFGQTGKRSFFVDESGVIRSTPQDREPTKSDSPVE